MKPEDGEKGQIQWTLKVKESLKKFFFNVYSFLRDRETEHEWGRGREREGDTESEAGSRLSAPSPTWGSNSQTVRS